MPDRVEWLVLVDEKDNELGVETRERCHEGQGMHHRAFVVFLFDGGRMLLQRRSGKKLLWPGFWDVSFTSHVYKGETYEEAGLRRAGQELGIRLENLERVLAFNYEASFGDHSENEYCALLVGSFSGEVKPDPDEITEVKYMTVEELSRDMKEHSDSYTPWFKIAFERYTQQGRA